MPDRIESIIDRIDAINEKVVELQKMFEDMQEHLAVQDRLITRLKTRTRKTTTVDEKESPSRKPVRRNVARSVKSNS